MKAKVLLSLVLIIAFLSACGNGGNGGGEENPSNGAENWTGANDGVFELGEEFFFSDGLNENGYWIGVTAGDYVESVNFRSVFVPWYMHHVSEEELMNVINNILDHFPNEQHIYDREVEFGDLVNIDFVGSVDGVEFAGGNTMGMGTNVTAGSRQYIADFLDQIIGAMPGDIINVEVTFPADYGEASLRNADALFVTTINYIVEQQDAELSDEFVMENLYPMFGWNNVTEMRDVITADMRNDSVMFHIGDLLVDSAVIKSVPPQLIEYQERMLIEDYRVHADRQGMALEVYLDMFYGGIDGLLTAYHDSIVSEARFALVIQAVAEELNLILTDEEIEDYFYRHTGSHDYSFYALMYGMPFIKNIIMVETIMDMVLENAELE
jgi:trigger factor